MSTLNTPRPARAAASVWLTPTKAAHFPTKKPGTTRCFQSTEELFEILRRRLEREAHPETEVSCIEETAEWSYVCDLAVFIQRGDGSIRE
jgi:hypothetical protein